ncbi:hypothetical protein Tco_0164783 [Tanacetum coccineum]
MKKSPLIGFLTWDDLCFEIHNKSSSLENNNSRKETREFNKNLMKHFTRHGTDSMIFGDARIMGFQNCINSDTFYNALNSMIKIIETPRRVASLPKVSTSSSTLAVSPDVAELKDMVRALILDKKNQTPAPKASKPSCGITTRSGVAYQGPAIPSTSYSLPKVMNRDIEVTKDTMLPTNKGSTEDVQPPVIQVQSQNPTSEPVVDPVSALRPNQQTSIPFPSRRNDERRREKANDQIEKFYKIFRDLSFVISFTDALTLMPKFALTLKTLIENKEKLSEMARTPLN